MTATEISALLAAQAEAVCQHLLPLGRREGREWRVGSIAGEAGNSMQVTLEGSKQGVWCDFAGAPEDRGDMIGLWRRARNISLSQACQEALDWLKVPEAQRNTHSQQPKAQKKFTPKVPDQRWLELQESMRPGTVQELQSLATLRRLPGIAGLQLATNHGHLWFCSVHDHGERHPAWLLTDGSRRNAQARKMDGSLWLFDGKRKPAKSKTIWGTDTHWPVGISEAGTPMVAFVEGAPDFLAAWHLIWLKGQTASIRPVAMFGASNEIHPESLPLFAGKGIWMFPHNDGEKGEGIKAALRWRGQLLPFITSLDLYEFSEHGLKDLNELITADAQADAEVQQ